MNTVEITLQVKDDGSVAFDHLKEKVSGLGDEVKKSTGTVGAFGESWTSTIGKITGVGVSIYGIIKTLQSFRDEAVKCEQAEKMVGYAIDRTGISYESVGSYMNSWIESTSKFYRKVNEVMKQGLTEMLLYTNGLTKAQKGVQLALDMSRKTGESYKMTLRLVEMAMLGYPEIAGCGVHELRTNHEPQMVHGRAESGLKP